MVMNGLAWVPQKAGPKAKAYMLYFIKAAQYRADGRADRRECYWAGQCLISQPGGAIFPEAMCTTEPQNISSGRRVGKPAVPATPHHHQHTAIPGLWTWVLRGITGSSANRATPCRRHIQHRHEEGPARLHPPEAARAQRAAQNTQPKAPAHRGPESLQWGLMSVCDNESEL